MISEVTIILLIILLFVASPSALAEAKIETALTFPVLIGIPRIEQISMARNEPMSQKNVLEGLASGLISERDFMIFPPPKSVEVSITTETSKTRKIGAWLVPSPISKKESTAMNFCPSCAPCIRELSAHEIVSRRPYGNRLFLNKSVIKRVKKYANMQEKTI